MEQYPITNQNSVIDGGLARAAGQFRATAQDMLAVYGARKPARSDQVTPPQLVEAMEQVLTIAGKLDVPEGETKRMGQDEVTQLGDYGLSLLLDLTTWAGQLGLAQARTPLEKTALAITEWIMRHDGEIKSLEPVVNALASRANSERDPQKLEQLANFMDAIVEHTADVVKQDLEKMNPGRPWRLLHLNRGIVATRSHNIRLMERIFDEFIRDFPEEAPGFFAQGMAQMDALNYPVNVRAVMSRYHARFQVPQQHLH